jgi:adenylate cyclase
MTREIERKFLLRDESWRQVVDSEVHLRQAYLTVAGEGRASVRVRSSGREASLNIKSLELGVMRDEYEYAVPLADAERMIRTLCTGAVIEKCRHRVIWEGHGWEIDEFKGDNAGLVVAEIELDEPDERFVRPPWLGREVTELERYYNVSLVRYPFRKWTDGERGGEI